MNLLMITETNTYRGSGKIDVKIKWEKYKEETCEPMKVIKKDNPLTLENIQLKKDSQIKICGSGQKDTKETQRCFTEYIAIY